MKTQKAVELQKELYDQNEQKIWGVINSMSDLELISTSVNRLAELCGVSRSTIYKHRTIYEEISRRKNKYIK